MHSKLSQTLVFINWGLDNPSLGILALEIKGGHLRYEDTNLVYPDGKKVYPHNQVGRSIHALSRWIGETNGLKLRIGWATVFPHSDFSFVDIPFLSDNTVNEGMNLCLSSPDLRNLGQKVVAIMQYWKKALNNRELGIQNIATIINLICGDRDYTPFWNARIIYDNQTWLSMTRNQKDILNRIEQAKKIVINGRSGTGKTIVALEYALNLHKQGKRALVLTFNRLLRDHLYELLQDTRHEVSTFHKLAYRVCEKLGYPLDSTNWIEEIVPKALMDYAHSIDDPNPFDALIIDEGQAFRKVWLRPITSRFKTKSILVCCDASQTFSYEEGLNADEIAEIIQAKKPYTLTANLRSPLTVFNRLEESFPTDYQQYSPRPNYPDTLDEIVTDNPMQTLEKILSKLALQNVPARSISIIYVTHYDPPIPE